MGDAGQPAQPGITRGEALEALRAGWPEWEIWIVPFSVGGERWCARRHDNHKHLLHGYTPAELAEYLADAGDA